jgi:hypothetical protein
MHRIATLERTGRLKEGLAFRLDARRAIGVERDSYAPPGEEGPGKVYVTGPAKIVGAIPAANLEYGRAKDILQASEERPVLLAYLDWNADLELEVLEVYEEEVAPPTPEPGETPKDGGKDGPRPGPVVRKERTVFLAADVERPYFLAIDRGRLALVEMKLGGPELCGYLPKQVDDPVYHQVLTGSRNTHFPSATIDPGTGLVHLQIVTGTRLKSSKDAFAVKLALRVRSRKGDLEGAWRTVPPAGK